MNTVKPHYATVNNPTVEAATNGLFRFKDENQAKDRIQSIKEYFITSKNQPEEKAETTVILWINGYSLEEDEIEKGYIGNYAIMGIEKTDDDRFTIKSTKLESELKYHPQRKRLKQKHPNWGHPILRSIKKKKVFGDIEQARSELMRLHEEYPDISIPCTNKTYIIIYGKVDGQKSPVQKYVLEVKVADGGGYYIDYSINNYKQTNTVTAVKSKEAAEPPKGYFTSMIEIKRKKKK